MRGGAWYETDGSIVYPANNCGVVGLKPTVGLTSRAGVVPIAHSQDTVGVHARTVADAAAVLGVLVGVDPRDVATSASAGRLHHDYTQFLDPGGLAGARIGVARHGLTGFSRAADRALDRAIRAMRDAGATVIDPANIPTIDTINRSFAEDVVLVHEFKRDLNAYLAGRRGIPIRDLADAIAFNDAHRRRELRWFGQEWFTLAQSDPYSRGAVPRCSGALPEAGRGAGIDARARIAPSGRADRAVRTAGLGHAPANRRPIIGWHRRPRRHRGISVDQRAGWVQAGSPARGYVYGHRLERAHPHPYCIGLRGSDTIPGLSRCRATTGTAPT